MSPILPAKPLAKTARCVGAARQGPKGPQPRRRAATACPDAWLPARIAGLALWLGALCLGAGGALAQLSDEGTISTQGTQFVRPDPPKPPKPPPRVEVPRAAPPRRPVPPRVQAPPKPPPRFPSVVFLVDASDSMLNTIPGGRTRLDEAKAALTRVIQGMSKETRVQLWTFNTRLHRVTVGGVRSGFIPVGRPGLRERLVERIKGIRTAGGTNLYKAVIETLEIFAAPQDQPLYQSGQRFPVLVVLSDGEDGGKTGHSLAAVLAAKRRFPLVTVNAIGFHISGEEKLYQQLCRIATRPEGCAAAGDQRHLQAILESFYRPSAALRQAGARR